MKNTVNINNQHGNFHVGGDFNVGSTTEGPLAASVNRTAAEPGIDAPLSGTERSTVRKMLGVNLRRDAEFDAFVLDCFAEIFRQFTPAMERDRKTNLLLETREPVDISNRLSQWCALR